MQSEYPVLDGNGATIVAKEFGNRGTHSVNGSFAQAGTSAVINVPPKGEEATEVHMTLGSQGDTWVANVNLEKSYDGFVTPIVIATYTAPDDQIYIEVEQGVQFRMNCTAFTSGPINYRLAAK